MQLPKLLPLLTSDSPRLAGIHCVSPSNSLDSVSDLKPDAEEKQEKNESIPNPSQQKERLLCFY